MTRKPQMWSVIDPRKVVDKCSNEHIYSLLADAISDIAELARAAEAARAETERLRAELYDAIKAINYDETRGEGEFHDDAEKYAETALTEWIAANIGEGE